MSGYKSILGGIQESSGFSSLYFSKANIEWMQKNIRYIIYKQNNYVIGNQDEKELIIIMRAFYLQYSNNPEKKEDYQKEILRLNRLSLDHIIPKISTQVDQYEGYLRDISKIADPIPRAQNVNIVGTKTNRGPSDVLGINSNV